MKQASYTCLKDCTRDALVPIYEEDQVCSSISENLGYEISSLVRTEFGAVTVIHTLGRFLCKRIIFLGMGKQSEMTTRKLREVFAKVPSVVKEPISLIAKKAVCETIDLQKVAEIFAEAYALSAYEEHKVEHDDKEFPDADVVANEDISASLLQGQIYAQGINHARDMANMPANYMTPKRLCEEAQEIAERYQLECTILDQVQLKELHAGGILSVNQGSDQEPYLIVLKYEGGLPTDPYTALIGKGLTFDAGGYNIKSDSYGMKYDMCGGADVLGAMEIIAASGFKQNVYAIVPATENLINGSAYKPQDVITTMSGKTVEIVNTDAEGRLILCDAITYAQTLPNVKQIVDIATLTGACARALGNVYTGVFSNNDAFYELFDQALQASDERGWRLPVAKEYRDVLKSNSADLKNVAKGSAGASVAACFLQEFVNDDVAWIHLDIAGVSDDEAHGATGAMVRTMANLCR